MIFNYVRTLCSRMHTMMYPCNALCTYLETKNLQATVQALYEMIFTEMATLRNCKSFLQ